MCAPPKFSNNRRSVDEQLLGRTDEFLLFFRLKLCTTLARVMPSLKRNSCPDRGETRVRQREGVEGGGDLPFLAHDVHECLGMKPRVVCVVDVT